MQSSRVANLARRLSNSESLLKNNLNVNQNITKECHAAAAHKNSEHSDAKRSHRFRLSSNPFYSEVDRVSALSCYNIIAREMATSSTSAGSKEVTPPKFTNRLAKEQSPYLLQHAHNPVDWFPWGDEAFEKAKTENKLIFLSVGYSTCHWCHVMEVESFENEEIAKVMNEHFINIKVDREERPDIDKVYMTFVQATSGRGGWPMSVFLTPELNPVTGGTYYPPYDKYGRPGFKTILTNLATKWKDQREDFMTTGAHIIEVLKQVSDLKKVEGDPETQLPGDICWKTCIRKYVKDYDPEFGGFGMQPKFPQASNFDFLFHVYARAKDSDEGKQCLDMCLYTLKKMAYGGIHDHISKGFARYSVDEKWHVPHFEKMLYDQAQLAIAYSDAYLATKDEFYAKVTRDIFEYVHRDMTHPEGGFYSAEDADSYPVEGAKEKKEGAFCLWEYEDVEALLDGKKLLEGDTKLRTPFTYFEILKTHYNIERGGNISTDSDPHGEMLNKNVFIILGSPEATAEKYGITVEKLDEIVEECRCILYAERQKRPRPHLDSKILCSWNGLMIAAYAKAGQVLADKEYIGRAVKAAMFVRKNLYNKEQGSLYRSCYRGDDGSIAQMSVPINGFLDDYAFLIRGLLDLYEASLNREWLYWASSLQEKQDALFWDPEGDGYFTSPLGDANVVLKLKEDQDGAEPSGNSVSIQNLLRLSAHMGGHGAAEQPPSGARRDRAARALAAFAPRLKMAPSALPQMVSALMLYMDSPTQVFIAGKRDDPRTIELLNVVRARLLPGRIVAVAEPAGGTPGRQSPTTVFSRIRPLGDRPAAYVCRHYTCLLPITDAKRLADVLDKDD